MKACHDVEHGECAAYVERMTDRYSLLSRLRKSLPLPDIPQIGRSVDVPVYMIHSGADAEDYFFIIDFEQFVEHSRKGLFVRPKLNVSAGRDDFDRAAFAQRFRENFAREFDLARSALSQSDESAGWFSWAGLKDLVSSGGASFVANVVLLAGLSAGKMIWSALSLPAIFEERSKKSQLEDAITATQSKVDEALAAMDVIVHRQLWEHAQKHGATLPKPELDINAWPLPEHVSNHLNDGKSSSWW
ncbi:MAG: hypothetical protein AAF340_05530 [Pseudomonadota bacterium]